MRVVCCICHSEIKVHKGGSDKISHGMCPKCVPKYLEDQGFTLEEIREFEEGRCND
jgi:hypothetical protein